MVAARCDGSAIAAAGNHKRTYNQRLQLQFLSSWWWVVCGPKHVEKLRNIGIINSTTRLHLVGSFYEVRKICISYSYLVRRVVVCRGKKDTKRKTAEVSRS